jgi:hypothetical protein
LQGADMPRLGRQDLLITRAGTVEFAPLMQGECRLKRIRGISARYSRIGVAV